MEGQPCWYSRDDWQLVKTDHSYEATKYQIDLIASKLNQRSLEPGGESDIVRHFLVHPGIVHSNMTNGMVYAFFDTLKVILFYIVSPTVSPFNRVLLIRLKARWFGSPNHPIVPYTSAVSAAHIALVSLLAIPTSLLAFAHRSSKGDPPASCWDDSLATCNIYDDGLRSADEARETEQRGEYVPLKFSARTDRWGRDHVGVMPVLDWKNNEKESEFLIEKCESLYEAFYKLHAESEKVKANGHANGKANGYTNGNANGHMSGHENGHAN